MVPNQILARWTEVHEGNEYGYAIRRGPTGSGYTVEGHWSPNFGKSDLPQFCFPVDQTYVSDEFAKLGKEWRQEKD